MTNKALVYSFLCFGLIPILPTNIQGLPVVLFVLVTFFSMTYTKIKIFRWKLLLVLILPYLFFCLSILYSENMMDAAKKVFETRLSLFILPLSFSILKNEQLQLLGRNQMVLKKIFVISCFVFCCIYFITVFFVPESENAAFLFPSGFFFKTVLNYIPFIKFEPVYISFVIILGIIFLSELMEKKIIRLSYGFILGLFFVGLLFVMVSKLALIFLIMYIVWLVFYYSNGYKIRTLVLLSLVVVSFFLVKIPALDYEIEEVKGFFKGEKIAKNDTSDIRKKIVISSFELSRKVNPFFGIGIGDVQSELNNVYKKNNYNQLLEKKHDTHNQYLSSYISTGVFGLAALCLVFFICLFLCIKSKSWYALWSVSLLFFQMLTECILERQLTVIIFSLVTSLVFFIPSKGDSVNFVKVKND